MEEQEKQFTKGFNNGYLIAKYQPDLFAKLEKNMDSSNEYVQGLLFGKKEHYFEKNIVQLENLKQKPSQSKEHKDKDFDKER